MVKLGNDGMGVYDTLSNIGDNGVSIHYILTDVGNDCMCVHRKFGLEVDGQL